MIGVPLLPIKHSTKDVGNNEATREAVNTWIRTSGAFDHVIDFEPSLADPADPLSLKASLTCDHVHPNQAGYTAMANSIRALRLSSSARRFYSRCEPWRPKDRSYRRD